MLRLEDICLRLGEFRLREISLNVKSGTYLGLLGPTGTGKTVLLETIAGVHTVSRGRIYIRGREATHLAPEKRHLGIVYQDYALFPHLTVFENIAFGLRLQGRPRRNIHKAVEKMAAFLEIGPLLQRRPHRLSGGERQRVALARALLAGAPVLVLDEPTSGLDRPTARRLVHDVLAATQGSTVVLITHRDEDLTEVDEVVVVDDGRVVRRYGRDVGGASDAGAVGAGGGPAPDAGGGATEPSSGVA